MPMNIDVQKQKLEDEKKLVQIELLKIARQESTGNWVAVPEQGDGAFADELDNADLTEEYEERIAIVKILEQQYTQIETALRAIKNGTYGICQEEGCEIAEKRLEVYPAATTCIKHAE